VRNPLRLASWGWLRRGPKFRYRAGCGSGHRFGCGLRRGSRVRGKGKQCQFRLLRHSGCSPDAPCSRPFAGIRHRPIHRPGSGTPYCNGNTAG
jgi:hypothetical protein